MKIYLIEGFTGTAIVVARSREHAAQLLGLARWTRLRYLGSALPAAEPHVVLSTMTEPVQNDVANWRRKRA